MKRRHALALVIFAIVASLVATYGASAQPSSDGSILCFDGFDGIPEGDAIRLTCRIPVPATTAPETTVAPTTTTAPPTTTSTTTVAPTTTTTSTTTTVPIVTIPPTTTTTTTVPAGGGFLETFDGNTGRNRFRTGVFHRENPNLTKTWKADHDLACGDAGTSRTVNASDPSKLVYLCRDHLMTTMGDMSPYSLVWFSPDQTFTRGEQTTVSWDVNVTNMGGRQWWEVAVDPVNTPDATAVEWLDAAGLPPHADGSIVWMWSSTAHMSLRTDFETGGQDITGWTGEQLDPEGSQSKMIRRPFSITDNMNGTVTIRFMGFAWTKAGQFPDEFKVVFKDHNYTPDKGDTGCRGGCVGYTWHWDNIAVT